MFKKSNLPTNKKNSKKGFTLVELVAVLAIISILAATLAPRVSGYITEAKKVTILNEAKTVITAFESVSYNIDADETTYDIKTLTDDYSNLITADSITKIPHETTIFDCRSLLDINSFSLSSDGTIISTPEN